MARRIDWMDFAHTLDKERERIQDMLPEGFRCWITLNCYGHGAAEFHVCINRPEEKIIGSGSARTPEKALVMAKQDFEKQLAEKLRQPRIASAVPALTSGAK